MGTFNTFTTSKYIKYKHVNIKKYLLDMFKPLHKTMFMSVHSKTWILSSNGIKMM